MGETFYLASTTAHGIGAAESLLAAGFTCLGVITPAPRPVGRHQVLTPSPVATWAEQKGLPVFPIVGKITCELETQLFPVDFILVVDFGYYIPRWLIAFPAVAAVNIHPSRLPEWRGASPGPAVILSGAPESAVSIMLVAPAMDAGDILAQIPFTIAPHWTSQDYYEAAFALAYRDLPGVLCDYQAGRLPASPQQGDPTLAPKIAKADAFIPWHELTDQRLAAMNDRKIRAYSPWPHAWTQVHTSDGEKRLQLLQAHLDNRQLVIDIAKLEGDTEKKWMDIIPKIQEPSAI